MTTFVASRYTNAKGETRFILNLSQDAAADLANGTASPDLSKACASLIKRKTNGKAIKHQVEEPAAEAEAAA